ncbi:MAG: DNA alkylation repair protein, partial [Planctomycetota bacterium]
MNLKQTMAELEAAGTAQNCKIYKRHGATGAMFGVSYAVLDKLAKQLNRDEHAHTLAMELWATGNHDARVLACKIADPEKVRARHVDAMAKQCRDHVVGDALCGLVIKTDVARSRAERWTSSRDEFVSMCGWSVMAGMAAVAVPVWDGQGKLLATLSAHAPIQRRSLV